MKYDSVLNESYEDFVTNLTLDGDRQLCFNLAEFKKALEIIS